MTEVCMRQNRVFEGYLLVSDMDGTILADNTYINDRNIEAIERFKEKGGRFTIATGRTQFSASRFLDRILINAPAIVCNGSAIYDFDRDEMIWSATLPDQCDDIIRKMIRKFPDIGIEVSCRGELFLISNSDFTLKHALDEQLIFQESDLEEAPKPWLKIVFAGDAARLREAEKYLEQFPHPGFYYVFSGINYMEALGEGVSKGSALEILAGRLEIPHRNTIAIGDYYNDWKMILSSGFGATVENAPEEIKKTANLVVGRCEDGALADLIDYLEEKFETRLKSGQ